MDHLAAAFIEHPLAFMVLGIGALVVTGIVMEGFSKMVLVLVRGWPPVAGREYDEDEDDLAYLHCADCGGTLGVASPELVD